jgi:hypothetical protein
MVRQLAELGLHAASRAGTGCPQARPPTAPWAYPTQGGDAVGGAAAQNTPPTVW